MTKIFLTGATGYVGGDLLHHLSISSGFSGYSVSCLVRGAENANLVSKAYPDIHVVKGDLDDASLIVQEARNSDIVVNLAATNHISSAESISKGLTDPERDTPAHWIQMSGATLLAGKEIAEGRFGFESNDTYDDVKDMGKVISIIKDSPKRAVDNLVIAQDDEKVKTALIVGPLIYGTGKGPGNTRSIQAPEIARVTLELKEGFRLGEGKNRWSNVHVHDLSSLIVGLVEAAVAKKSGLWNTDGVYFPENGVLAFGELCQQIASEAKEQGLIKDGTVKRTMDAKEADAMSGYASVLWGTNAITHSSRAHLLLGWNPSNPSLNEEIPDVVRREGEKKAAEVHVEL